MIVEDDNAFLSCARHLGNLVEFTIKQLVELVLELTAAKSELVYKPLLEDDPMQRQPDISRAKATLGWQRVFSLSRVQNTP